MGKNSIWEYHEGLWRYFNPERFIPYAQKKKYSITDANLRNGNVFIKKYSEASGKKAEILQKEYVRKGMSRHDQEWYEQDHWAYNSKTGYVYRIRMKDGQQIEKKCCGYVVPNTSVWSVSSLIEDRVITVNTEYTRENTTHRVHWDILNQNKWSIEFDGKNILALVIAKPKMTFNEIKNIILNEGGSVDSEGIIHKA